MDLNLEKIKSEYLCLNLDREIELELKVCDRSVASLRNQQEIIRK